VSHSSADTPVTAPEPRGRTTRDGASRDAAKSPLMAQYARVKSEHPDAFLFFRLGDFYEMFFEDAIQGARLLGLTLTSRNKSDPEPIPMCGIPWHQRDAYVAKLLRLGHKIAICDQLEDASAAKGIVQRGVTEVLTPGSVVGDSFLEPAANNFLASVWPTDTGLGLCLADASTGEVRLAEADWPEVAGLLAPLRVSEWLVPESISLPEALRSRLDGALAGLAGARSAEEPAAFLQPARAQERWPHVAETLLAMPRAAAAAAAAIAYLDRVQGGVALATARSERWRTD